MLTASRSVPCQGNDDAAISQGVDRALFVWLLLASFIGVLAGMPWTVAVLGHSSIVWRNAAIEFLFLLAPACAVGVWLGKKVNLGTELRELASRARSWRRGMPWLGPTILAGMTLGGLSYFAQNSIPNSAWIPGLSNPNALEWFLRCISAALTEEVFFRFGLMTLFVWLVRSGFKRPGVGVSSLWIGNLASALIFAGAHLPQLAAGGLILAVTVVSSTSVGMVMGWLFMRFGLTCAIVFHFTVDLMVYVVPRVLTGAS